MNFVKATFLAFSLASLGLAGCADANDSDGDDGVSVGEELNAGASWQTLGARQVDGHGDHDTIVVGADEGSFTAVKFRVQGSALIMNDIKIVFGNGETYSPHVSWFFDENTSSQWIDFLGRSRNIKRVEFKYSNVPGGGKASIQLLGKSDAPSPWQSLGARQVDGHFDTDRIFVGSDDGKMTALKLHVEDSSLVMFDIRVTFGNGETWSPNVRLVFDEDSASRVIDLPGGARNIKRVDFKYGNLPTGGKARVQLWGKR